MIMHELISYPESDWLDFMPKLKNILKKEIKSIENLPDAGLNEHNITLLERFIAKKKA